MKRRNVLCVALSLCLLLALLAGCGSAPAAERGTQASTTPAATGGESPETPPAPPEGSGQPEGTPPAGQPGEMPPEGQPGGPGGTPPEGQPGGPGGTPPEGQPGGPGGTPPEGQPGGPGGTPPEGQPGGPGGTPPEGQPGGPGGSAEIEYQAAAEITEAGARKGETYASSSADENALLITAPGKVELTNPTVTKTGSSQGGDACSFYGLNAAVLAKDGTQVSITGGSVTTDAEGANGVFCYGGNGGRNGAQGDGTTLSIRNTVIRTGGNGSGGIMTTGGGVTYAYDLDVETEGRSSAAIRTDRGGGQVYVEGGRYVSKGLGSPAIYSTAAVHAANAALISECAEGLCIEGKNSIELTDCELIADNTQRNGNARFLDSVMLYQSMSGDAASGSSAFTMDGGSLTSRSGHVFHVTNTSAVITLRGVEIVNEDPENVLLSVCDDGWSGAGHACVLKAYAQQLAGALKVGSNASLSLELTEGSAFTGSIDGKITNAAGESVSTETGTVSVSLDEDSTWTLSADSYITEFQGSAANVIAGGHTLYVNGQPLTGTR